MASHLFERSGDPSRGLIDPARAVLGRSGTRITHHTAGGDVACEPCEGSGSILGPKQFGLVDLSDVVDGVRGSVDKLRHSAEEKCGFNFASVKTIGLFLFAHTLKPDASRAIERKCAQAELRTKIARHHVDER